MHEREPSQRSFFRMRSLDWAPGNPTRNAYRARAASDANRSFRLYDRDLENSQAGVAPSYIDYRGARDRDEAHSAIGYCELIIIVECVLALWLYPHQRTTVSYLLISALVLLEIGGHFVY